MDIQEEQLRAGRTPADGIEPPFGVEPESRWGFIHDGATGHVTKVKTEAGTYIDFYKKVAQGIRLSESGKDRAEEVGLVSAQVGTLVVQIIEVTKKSSDEGKTISFQPIFF